MTYSYSRNLVNNKYDLDAEYLYDQIVDQIRTCIVNCLASSCQIYFEEALSDQEKTTLDGIVEAARTKIALGPQKLLRILSVHEKTQENENLGVPYNNYRFSITPAAKTNWLAVVMSKDSLSYPFSAPTGFGVIYNFQNSSDVSGFFSASMAYIKYWEESDEQLVIDINACTTIEQLNAITDDRSYPPS